MILVTGANGNVGGEIVGQLVSAGHAVRVLLRTRANAADLPAHVEIAIGDFADSGSLERAVDGVEAVYMASFEHPELLGLQSNLITVARDAGVRVMVRLSGMGANPHAPETVMRNHGLCDRQLAESGLGYVLLQPNWFYQNFLYYIPQGVMSLPAGDGRTSFIDVGDIAAVAVAALTEQKHLGDAFVLTGPEALKHAEAAHILSEGIGKPLVFEDVSDETWRAKAARSGMEMSEIDGMSGLFRLIRDGGMAEITDDVERIIGRPPIRLAAFARDNG